jgi:hypothetical protein
VSRAERERWARAEEAWPNLQAFLSQRVPDHVFGNMKALRAELDAAIAELDFDQRADIASECRNFLQSFKNQYDDREFLRDGLGVRGELPIDDRGRGQLGLARGKVVYDSFVASLRAEVEGWQPAS